MRAEGARITREQEFILGALRLEDARAEATRALITEGLEWAIVDHLAEEHGVSALLYERLRRHALPVPEGVMAGLKRRYLGMLRQNLRLHHLLATLLRALDARGIDVIVLKGPSLSLRAYGDPALREYVDLDILIKREDFAAVAAGAEAVGFTPCAETLPQPHAPLFDQDKHFEFLHPLTRLEVHWSLSEPLLDFPIPREHYWRDTRVIDLDGCPMRILSPVSEMLMLCLHGVEHRWEQLKWILDVGYLVQRAQAEIDWHALFAHARAHGLHRVCAHALHLTRQVTGVTLPTVVEHAIAGDAEVAWLTDTALARLFEPAGDDRGIFTDVTYWYRSRERARERWRYLRHFAFAPRDTDRSAVPLPATLSVLYVVARPFRLLAQYRQALVAYLLRGRAKAPADQAP